MPRPLLALALVAAAVAAGCGDDDEPAGPVEGTGYTYELPEGWQDQSGLGDEASEQVDETLPAPIGADVDSLSADETEDGFATNVNVIRTSSIAPGVTAEQIARQNARVLGSPGPAAQILPEGSEILGEVAIGEVDLGGDVASSLEYSATFEGRSNRLRQLFAVRGGNAYTITFTALEDLFDDEVADLDQLIESWRWN
ncbi:MAG: hypothetical protein ACRDK9_08400 [Solirubrobacterales bacterium]